MSNTDIEPTNTAVEKAVVAAFSEPTLTNQLRELAEARKRLNYAKSYEEGQEQILRETQEWQFWQSAIATRRDTESEIATLEGNVRAHACELYYDYEQKPPPGVTIKTFTVVEYDRDEAERWARAHFPAVLVLDPRRFEKAVKDKLADGAPVTVVNDVRAQISSDLSAYLEQTT